jgi:hypothetical protein
MRFAGLIETGADIRRLGPNWWSEILGRRCDNQRPSREDKQSKHQASYQFKRFHPAYP